MRNWHSFQIVAKDMSTIIADTIPYFCIIVYYSQQSMLPNVSNFHQRTPIAFSTLWFRYAVNNKVMPLNDRVSTNILIA